MTIVSFLLTSSLRCTVSLIPYSSVLHRKPLSNEKKNSLFAQNIVAKTKESFKLSDLYLLESILQSNVRGYETTQLLSKDNNTGSYLLKMDKAFIENISETRPSCLDRLDWIAEILVSGKSGEDFVHNLIQKKLEFQRFSIDYTCIGKFPGTKDYSSKTLLCRVSQCIIGEVSLISSDFIDQLLIVESDDGLYLLQQIQNWKNDNYNSMVDKHWKDRPFQYSSAMNLNIAKIVIDILYDVTMCSSDTDKTNITLLDPTCGSGTFLAYGLEKGLSVTGCDIRDKCVEGTRTNIKFMFPDMDVSDSVSQCDFSAQDIHFEQLVRNHDLCVTNLPWGQNTEVSNEDCNRMILLNVYSHLKSNGYAVIISKQNVDHDILSCGFITLGSVTIPPHGFVLPGNKSQNKSTSDCAISVVTKR